MMSERQKVGGLRFKFNTWWGYTVALCLIISKPATREKLNSFCPLGSEELQKFQQRENFLITCEGLPC